MHNTIFITLEGGVIQNINVTDDLDNIKAIVIDFDVDGVEEDLTLIDGHLAVIYDYGVDKIDDGDVERFEEMVKEGNRETEKISGGED